MVGQVFNVRLPIRILFLVVCPQITLILCVWVCLCEWALRFYLRNDRAPRECNKFRNLVRSEYQVLSGHIVAEKTYVLAKL